MIHEIASLQARIFTIFGGEGRLGNHPVNALRTAQEHANSESRAEAVHLAILRNERDQQKNASADQEQKYSEELHREGDDLMHMSEEIRIEYVEETLRREAANKRLQEKEAALEQKLRVIESTQPMTFSS